jgi:hypothetical protein
LTIAFNVTVIVNVCSGEWLAHLRINPISFILLRSLLLRRRAYISSYVMGGGDFHGVEDVDVSTETLAKDSITMYLSYYYD